MANSTIQANHGATSYPCFTQRPTGYVSICTDLNIILNHSFSNLRKREPTKFFVVNMPGPLDPNYCSRFYHAVCTNRHIVFDMAIPHDNGICSDGAPSDICKWSDTG